MKILIVEDEPRAAHRLERMVKAQMPDAEVLEHIPSVKGALGWLTENAEPDLIFLDVRLEDGESFEILRQHDVSAPIIFCTAYSEYALEAFEVNSIDYLLKPVNKEKLARALEKYARYSGFRIAVDGWQFLSDPIPKEHYKKRFMVPSEKNWVMLEAEKIILLEAYLKGTKLTDLDGREWFLDDPLSTIETSLNPMEFFRISRQDVIRLSAVIGLHKTDGGHLLQLSGVTELRQISRARVNAFKRALM